MDRVGKPDGVTTSRRQLAPAALTLTRTVDGAPVISQPVLVDVRRLHARWGPAATRPCRHDLGVGGTP